jgi:hypothetical protein
MSTGLPSADYETDREQIAAIIANRAPELSTAPTAFAGEQAGAFAELSQGIGGDIDQAGRDSPPSADSSDQGLNNWAEAIGISNGAGGYGRRGATFAQGYAANLTGFAGTAYVGADVATSSNPAQQATGPGGVVLVLRTSVTIPASPATGQITGTWDADPSSPSSQGTAGNLPKNTQLTLVAPPPGSDSTITLATGPQIAGQDQEQNGALLIRIQFKMQRPPNGGNGTDFATWAETATDSNGNPITTVEIFAYVYPNYYGDGLPLIVVLQPGDGQGRRVSNFIVAAISDYINGSTTREGQRPVGSTATVATGFLPDSRALVCYVPVVPSKDAYQFDWLRSGVTYAVNSTTTSGLPSWATSAGANVVLELNAQAPVSLKDAISAGSGPRVQVDTNNAGAILGNVQPDQWEVVAFNDSPGPPPIRTSLGLKVPSASIFGSTVFVGNSVYPGGPVVSPVGANILATINGNGPSRASGLADPAQLWQDVVGVTTLSTAAETTLDQDGVTRLVARCVAGQVKIGIGGAGALLVQDVQASDNTINGPEVLYAGRVLVVDG